MSSCVSRSSLQLWQFGSEQYGEPIGMCGELGRGLEVLAIHGLLGKTYPLHMRPTPQARRSYVEEMSAAYDIRMGRGCSRRTLGSANKRHGDDNGAFRTGLWKDMAAAHPSNSSETTTLRVPHSCVLCKGGISPCPLATCVSDPDRILLCASVRE
jgi:hypothetical protein